MHKGWYQSFKFDDHDILVRYIPGDDVCKVIFMMQGPRGTPGEAVRKFDNEPEAWDFYNCLDEGQVWAETKDLRMKMKQAINEKYLNERDGNTE